MYSHCTFTENLLLADGGIPLLKSKLKTKYIQRWLGGTLRHRDSRPYWAVRSSPSSTGLSPQCSSANFHCVSQHQQHLPITVEQIKFPIGTETKCKNLSNLFPANDNILAVFSPPNDVRLGKYNIQSLENLFSLFGTSPFLQSQNIMSKKTLG